MHDHGEGLLVIMHEWPLISGMITAAGGAVGGESRGGGEGGRGGVG